MRRALKAAWCVVVVGMAASAHAQTLEGVSDRHAAAALNRERARAMSDYAEVTEFVVEDETCSRNSKRARFRGGCGHACCTRQQRGRPRRFAFKSPRW